MIEVDVGVGVVAGLGILAIRQPLAEIFSTDAAVITATASVLVWVAISQPLSGFVFALDGILIGAGDLTYLGRSMAATAAVFTAVALLLIQAGSGLGWLWAALVGFIGLRAVAVWWRWRSDRWLVLGA